MHGSVYREMCGVNCMMESIRWTIASLSYVNWSRNCNSYVNRYFDFNETQVIGRCERVMIRHDIVGVRKEKVILIVTGPFPFGLITRYDLNPR